MGSSAREIEAALKEQILKDHEALAEIKDIVRTTARVGANYGKSIAPVGDDKDKHPGKFRDSIQARDRKDYDGLPAAQIYSDDPAASFIEYGTARTPEHATFARIAQYLGMEQTHAHFESDY